MKMKMKKQGGMDPLQKKAKMNIMQALRDDAGEMMKDNLKKVVVSSSSKEGLEKGLEKAKQLMENPEVEAALGENEEMEDEMEEGELPELKEEGDPQEQMALDEIEEKIKELQRLKEKKLGRGAMGRVEDMEE